MVGENPVPQSFLFALRVPSVVARSDDPATEGSLDGGASV